MIKLFLDLKIILKSLDEIRILIKEENVKMEMTKENLFEVLVEFFGLNDSDGTYVYDLTRVKEAYSVGTMTMDDFVEFDEERCDELANYLWDKFSK